MDIRLDLFFVEALRALVVSLGPEAGEGAVWDVARRAGVFRKLSSAQPASHVFWFFNCRRRQKNS